MSLSRVFYLSIFILLVVSTACNPAVNDEDLYGVWQYVKVENPNQGSVTPDEELKENNPSIRFSKGKKLEMIWGGRALSEGTYHIEYPVINYEENLKEQGSRKIKFLIKKLEDGVLVFQTMEADAVRVTARKLK
ncbi:hypothetical protein B0I27_10333 [Arcticibacter pallidicorallinus]|uniref:Lipocalin-like protein n=1 Tax=Arcticibacter pallidicorallinus TaxID=1259464 RepID=A0A2T0U6S6_9SPHI|nr:hypothetical protein [Arcticibacter pallidicorallinus]PRY53568.1 hypothetical protein B0I27_10333 [Arcticibacter pallidicorallinus]